MSPSWNKFWSPAFQCAGAGLAPSATCMKFVKAASTSCQNHLVGMQNRGCWPYALSWVVDFLFLPCWAFLAHTTHNHGAFFALHRFRAYCLLRLLCGICISLRTRTSSSLLDTPYLVHTRPNLWFLLHNEHTNRANKPLSRFDILVFDPWSFHSLARFALIREGIMKRLVPKSRDSRANVVIRKVNGRGQN